MKNGSNSIYIKVYCISFPVEGLQSVGLSVAIHRFLGVISLTQGIINGIKQFYSRSYTGEVSSKCWIAKCEKKLLQLEMDPFFFNIFFIRQDQLFRQIGFKFYVSYFDWLFQIVIYSDIFWAEAIFNE